MEADFALDGAIVGEFGASISGDGVNFVETLPGEVGGIGKEGAIEAADHASELELTEPVSLEPDVGRLYHIQVITVPERHFDDPPLADQRALGAAPHVASRSLGIRTRL